MILIFKNMLIIISLVLVSCDLEEDRSSKRERATFPLLNICEHKIDRILSDYQVNYKKIIFDMNVEAFGHIIGYVEISTNKSKLYLESAVNHLFFSCYPTVSVEKSIENVTTIPLYSRGESHFYLRKNKNGLSFYFKDRDFKK